MVDAEGFNLIRTSSWAKALSEQVLVVGTEEARI
jgi:hypothetical protein